MKFDVHVEIRALEGVADPAGQTVERALPALGFTGVEAVHIGRVVTCVLEAADDAAAAATAQAMCERLLANPVIERFELSVSPAVTASVVGSGGDGT